MTLAGKVAVVTGAARGIGLACARRLAREGARVVLADRDDAAAAAAKEFAAEDADVIYVNCDVSERLDVLNLVAASLEAYERIDILINNAGVLDDAPFLELEEAEFQRVLDINLRGSFLVGQAVARQMVKQVEQRVTTRGEDESPGSIVNMSSVNARFGIANRIAYSVSKAGIENLTRGMAIALAPHGIRVNAIGPGTIDTDLAADALDDGEKLAAKLARTPLGRIGQPDEIAAIAAFLASDAASFVTGETVFADGGRLALAGLMPPKV